MSTLLVYGGTESHAWQPSRAAGTLEQAIRALEEDAIWDEVIITDKIRKTADVNSEFDPELSTRVVDWIVAHFNKRPKQVLLTNMCHDAYRYARIRLGQYYDAVDDVIMRRKTS